MVLGLVIFYFSFLSFVYYCNIKTLHKRIDHLENELQKSQKKLNLISDLGKLNLTMHHYEKMKDETDKAIEKANKQAKSSLERKSRKD